jgi:DNA-binding Lrp family transcriptional regulator
MPKSSKEQIDEDEKKIIKLLQKNSEESIDKIAKKCGFSRQKVWRIKKKLEKNKIIWGYHAVVEDDRMDMKRYQILIKKTPVPMSNDIIEVMLGKNIRIELEKSGIMFYNSLYTQGYFDWSLCITAPDIIKVKKFIEFLKIKFENHISDIQVLEVIFPFLKSGIDNPNLNEFKEFLAIE